MATVYRVDWVNGTTYVGDGEIKIDTDRNGGGSRKTFLELREYFSISTRGLDVCLQENDTEVELNDRSLAEVQATLANKDRLNSGPLKINTDNCVYSQIGKR